MTERRVLVVDDDENNRLLLRTVLESAGYAIAEAADSARALAAVNAFRPHVAVVDLHLGAENGTGLVTRLRADKSLHDLKIVLYTASELSAALRDFMTAMRVDGRIAKPAEPADILAAVARYF